MTSAQTHFRNGDLQAALAAISEELRTDPGHLGKRTFLAELLCIQGEFERADRQLEILLSLDQQALLTVGTWRQLIRAAQARHEVFTQGRVPDMVDAPSPRIRTLLDIGLALREGRAAEAAAAADALEQARAPCPVVANGSAVDDLRDLDDLCAGILEVLSTTGKYYWVDMEQVESLRFQRAERPLDQLWRRARLILRDGTDGEVFIPAIYPGAEDDAARLGRRTDWQDLGGLVRGQGLRTWLVGDEAVPLSEIDSIEAAA